MLMFDDGLLFLKKTSFAIIPGRMGGSDCAHVAGAPADASLLGHHDARSQQAHLAVAPQPGPAHRRLSAQRGRPPRPGVYPHSLRPR